ncbi:MAG: hypothetical protein WBM35_01680, partial [Candidatus Electrothrix sp.]
MQSPLFMHPSSYRSSHRTKNLCVLMVFSTMFFFPGAWDFATGATKITEAKDISPKQLTLEEAISRALRHNRQLRSSALDLNSRQISLDEARDRFSVQISPLSSINYSTSASKDGDEDHEDRIIWRVGGEV